ncbi:MAG: FAD:protein FMN transferase [Oscillospiraceae bacterium]|nr:FAD:protein FMN transferase [Oscillospiraceae bacterium]
MELDLGAIAKGYAGERAAVLLRENGVTSALLNMGGNVQTVGVKPDGSLWRIGIQDPNSDTGDYLGVVELNDQAAVTSGGYQRYFEEDGVRYWHIMDPATGAPARSGIVSATIVAHEGGLCDGLSTSLFIMGVEKSLDYWRTYGGFDVILVDEDNTVWITAGLKERFTLAKDAYTLQIVEE